MKRVSFFSVFLFFCSVFAEEIPPVRVLRTAYGYLSAPKFLAFLNGTQESVLFEGMGTAALLGAVFAGGFALNMTPCVLPMIPVNLSIIGVGNDPVHRGRSFLRALVYASGIMLSCGVAGLIAVLCGVSLASFASLWYVNLIAAIIFLLLALSMFDVYLLDLSRFRAGFKMPSAARLTGVFLLGSVTAILAGACVAPVVIAVLLQSAGLYAAGHISGLLLPFVLGAGMALPWPMLALGLGVLPRPGAWMKHVKHGFGVLIALTGIYYGVQAWQLFSAKVIPVQKDLTIAEAVQQARLEQKPVLIDFHASWCRNCTAMEHTVMRDSGVRNAMQNFKFVRFDATDYNDLSVRAVLDRFAIRGLPAFVIAEPIESSKEPRQAQGPKGVSLSN